MDIFDRYEKHIEDSEKEEFFKFKKAAREYSEQGFSENMVSELLTVDGCSKKVASKLSEFASGTLPDDYSHGDPPKTFEDVSRRVEDSIKSAHIQDLEKYFTKYATKEFKETIERIKTARATGLPSHFKEVVAEVRPLVDSIILANRTNCFVGDETDFGEKEMLEQELWGIWPVDVIKKHSEKEEGAKRVVKKAEKIEKIRGMPLFTM